MKTGDCIQGKEGHRKSRKQSQLTLFAEASLDHASRSPLPGSKEARAMTVTSGRICLGSYKNAIQDGLLVKMFLESSIWASTRCFLTWKVRDMKSSRRLLFQLAVSMPRTEGIESGLLLTPSTEDHKSDGQKQMEKWSDAQKLGKRPCSSAQRLRNQIHFYATPNAADSVGSHGGGQGRSLRTDMWNLTHQGLLHTPRANENGETNETFIKRNADRGDHCFSGLAAQVKAMYPTPRSADYKGATTASGCTKKRMENGQANLPEYVVETNYLSQPTFSDSPQLTGCLNPRFVEAMMGFPAGWTEL